jgi:CheY-like chemotaxis protein
LLCNAIRYTDRYGTILVACRCRGEFLRIEVSDNGCGISEMDQANIFREFYQINRPGLDAGKGLGLGLAIVDRLTKLLGHKIDLRSAPGKGSRFAIEVPLGALSSKSYPAAVPQITLDNLPDTIKSPLTGLRLLCVDDDEAVLSGTVNLLSSWGCKVSQASSLEEVNDYLHNGEEWDFIVSDYQLQNNTNGIQVISRVQQHQKQAIPCILITGDTSQEVLQLASTHGYTLMYKPLKPAKLRSLITHLLSESEHSCS